MPVAPESGAPSFAALADSLRSTLAANAFFNASATSTPPTIDVVVPIYNAADDLAACLSSVATASDHPFRLILLNDGSTDGRVSELVATLQKQSPGVLVVNRNENLGFVRTVNEGFAFSRTNDVVILNSDTIVPPGWLSRLVTARNSRPSVATVTPLTNNGTLCSVPIPFRVNQLPDGYGVDDVDALVRRLSFRLLPEAPTGVGFCMLVTRAALDAVGGFDAGVFERGYGEENDFCQRAIAKGFVNLIADDLFVFHKGSASFGASREAWLERNLARLADRHPGYARAVGTYEQNHPLRLFHARLQAAIAVEDRGRGLVARSVLHVLHQGGGTERHARDLAAIPDARTVSYVLTSDGEALTLDEYREGSPTGSSRFPLMAPLPQVGPFSDPAYSAVFSTICEAVRPDLVHVHHLLHHTLDIGRIAAEQGIRYVATLHDHYAMCPSYTLLNEDDQPCSACRCPGDLEQAARCMRRFDKPASYLAEHQTHMHDFLDGAARLFVPSESARGIVALRFPDLAGRLEVVEHGHAATTSPVPLSTSTLAPAARSPNLKVAVIGHLDAHKGLQPFKNLLRASRREDIEFHFYGTSPDEDLASEPGVPRRLGSAMLTYHGPYQWAAIVDRLRRDHIDVGLVLSIWPETHCYTLSEFVAAGVPVVVGDLGAQADRVRRFKLGRVVPEPRDPHAVLGVLERLATNTRELTDVVSQMDVAGALRPIEEMWADYRSAYADVLGSRGSPPVRSSGPRGHGAYVRFLTNRLAQAEARIGEQTRLAAAAGAELSWFQERMRSPRHVVAERLARAVQRVPVLWPIIAAVTEFVLRQRSRPQNRHDQTR